jgi:hypothetical protein
VIDLRAVLQPHRHKIDPASLPELLRPAKGTFGLADFEKELLRRS